MKETRATVIVIASLLTFTAMSSVASADGYKGIGSTPAEMPILATMDRMSAQSHLGVSSSTSFFDEESPDFNNRIDLYGQFVSSSGVGGYAALPYSFILDEDNISAIGNLELGGILALENAPLPIVLRGGLVLPTAGDGLDDFVVNLFLSMGRLTDLPTVIPEVTWVRLSASPRITLGKIYLRADAGVDVAIDAPEGIDLDALFRLNLAGGIMLTNTLALSAELVTVGLTGDLDANDDRFFHTASVSMHGRTSAGISPYGAITIPIDEDPSQLVNLVIMVGAQMALGH